MRPLVLTIWVDTSFPLVAGEPRNALLAHASRRYTPYLPAPVLGDDGIIGNAHPAGAREAGREENVPVRGRHARHRQVVLSHLSSRTWVLVPSTGV